MTKGSPAFHYHWLSLLSDNCRHAGCPPLMQPPAPVTALVASGPQFGFGSAPMSACLDVFAATPGVPVTAPWIAGNWRVTCAGTGSCTIALTRVVAAKPSICALQQPGSSPSRSGWAYSGRRPAIPSGIHSMSGFGRTPRTRAPSPLAISLTLRANRRSCRQSRNQRQLSQCCRLPRWRSHPARRSRCRQL
jgi:hypothetical protein